jgi:ERCC4-type nuclease
MIIKKHKSPLPPPMPYYPKTKTISSIENIFNFKQIKTPCPNPKTPIIIDTREKNSMILSLLHQQKANIQLRKLEIGDYLIGKIAIERKTQTDLINSLKTNRLHKQIEQLKQYKKPLIILENSNIHSQIHPNAINGIIISITLHHNIPIIYTESEKHTTQILIQIAKGQQKQSQLNKTKTPESPEKQKQYILESFPGIGPTTAQKLLQNYPTLKTIFNLNEKELEKYLNQKTLEKFKQTLNN